MDKTVIILIGAGVCCVVIGFALFVKLLTTKSNDDDEATGNRKLLDEEYAENFKECFENTGNIEEALEQLAQIYLDNQFMYNLIVSALDYIRDEQGDYETALEKINVDSDVTIMKMHNDAIKKALNIDTSSTSSKKNKAKKKSKKMIVEAETFDDEDEESEIEPEKPEPEPEPKPTKKTVKKQVKKAKKYEPEEEFEEDDEEEEEIQPKPVKEQPAKKPAPVDMDNFDDDDLDDFKIG